CDNGTEFKNHDMNQFCRMKGIKREFSVARTPQQNEVAKRKNKTLIKAARTMLADSLLHIPFWAEAVNTAYYVQNREILHINFLENKPNFARIGPKWLFDIDTLTMSMNYQPVVAGNQPNDNAGIKENLDADDDVADDAFEVKETENDVHVSTNESNKTDKKKHDEKAKRDDNGKSPVDSLKGVRDLRAE
nr:putative ribonuclease H-like domain-containing protein [Tanacetum cinerariifolium]